MNLFEQLNPWPRKPDAFCSRNSPHHFLIGQRLVASISKTEPSAHAGIVEPGASFHPLRPALSLPCPVRFPEVLLPSFGARLLVITRRTGCPFIAS